MYFVPRLLYSRLLVATLFPLAFGHAERGRCVSGKSSCLDLPAILFTNYPRCEWCRERVPSTTSVASSTWYTIAPPLHWPRVDAVSPAGPREPMANVDGRRDPRRERD
ncbi:hypothetical protein PYCCODRAFT_378575 [Trametes coccinea BRFM310]|uniref:Secreted protein n=1 Tax=Trametes coccinea (strain BRFM310) TaxID=1353009 RepID=A0A1Y2J5D6_TRAC3|nr:hypothetical protein PYCCODRAFT_378575 [Trametes coccinea BRFM310]